MRNNLFICDNDEKYCLRLYGYLKEKMSMTFDIQGFTDIDEILQKTEMAKEAVLVVSENMLSNNESAAKIFELIKNIIILDENCEMLVEEPGAPYGEETRNIKHISKYQSCERIAQSILDMCLKNPDISGKLSFSERSLNIISFYTPVKTIYQTDISLLFAELVSGQMNEDKTLFITTDCICSFKDIIARDDEETIADLIYYAECEKQYLAKFSMYLEKIRKKIGNTYYIPAVKNGKDLRGVKEDSFRGLISNIEKCGIYDNLVIDLSEGTDGFLSIVRGSSFHIVLKDSSEYGQRAINAYKEELKLLDGFDMEKLIEEDITSINEKLPSKKNEEYTVAKILSKYKKCTRGMRTNEK